MKSNPEELKNIIGEAESQISKGVPYIHKKSGQTYYITKIVLREIDCCPLVEYFNKEHHMIPWTRPLNEFLEKYERQK